MTVVSADAATIVCTSSSASSSVIAPASAASNIAMPRLSGARFSRSVALPIQPPSVSTSAIASSNSSFGGPSVDHTM